MPYILLSAYTMMPMGLFDSFDDAKKAGQESEELCGKMESLAGKVPADVGYYLIECKNNTYNWKVHIGDQFGSVVSMVDSPKPMKLSEEMCNFLGLPRDVYMTIPSCTRRVVEYIKNNGLQDPENTRNIIPDAKLRTILRYVDQLSYFNLQKAMKHNFMG